jgi:multimeric flavodoxin WrbA
MKVLNILGSPRRKGTSSRIAQAFTDRIEKNGGEVNSFHLNELTYRGCQGCETCHTKKDSCVLRDDLTPVLEAMRTADVIVFSTPVYYGDVSGQFKMFFDRTWSHVAVNYESDSPYASRIPEGKTALFILTQGDVEDRHGDVVERYRSFCDLYGLDTKVIRATGLEGPDSDVSEAQARAAKLADELTANRHN